MSMRIPCKINWFGKETIFELTEKFAEYLQGKKGSVSEICFISLVQVTFLSGYFCCNRVCFSRSLCISICFIVFHMSSQPGEAAVPLCDSHLRLFRRTLIPSLFL